MKIEAEIFRAKQPANSTHILQFMFEGIPMQVGITIEDGELCGSGFVTRR